MKLLHLTRKRKFSEPVPEIKRRTAEELPPLSEGTKLALLGYGIVRAMIGEKNAG